MATGIQVCRVCLLQSRILLSIISVLAHIVGLFFSHTDLFPAVGSVAGWVIVFLKVGLVVDVGIVGLLEVVRLIELLGGIAIGCPRPPEMSTVSMSVTALDPLAVVARPALVVLTQQEIHVLLDLVGSKARLPRLDELLLLQSQAGPPEQQPSYHVVGDRDAVLLQLSQGLAVISTIGHQCLITSSAHRVEELLQGPWHLPPCHHT